jgi:hypothetical protein
MSEYRPQSHAGAPLLAIARLTVSGGTMVLVAYLALCACEARAGEIPGEIPRLQPDDLRPPPAPERKTFSVFGPPYASMTGPYALPEVNEAPSYPSKDFRPRGRSVYETDGHGPGEGNLDFNATVWQRLNEYRNRDRIRVLTLWESGASAVSLQTDHHGGPSLQWTSRLMNRGGATRGVLDRLFPVSVFTGSHTILGHSISSAPTRVPSTVPHNAPSAVP